MLPFLERLQDSRPLLVDGATGTELQRRGVNTEGTSWTARAITEAPEILAAIHRDYVDAGAELITANTFRTHARSLVDLGQQHDAPSLTAKAVEIARTAAQGRAYIAGSIAPLGDCYSPDQTPFPEDLVAEHRLMAQHLADAGVDLILIETQLTIREACAASAAVAATGVPFAVSFVCDRQGNLLSGESLLAAATAVAKDGPVAILVNCIPAEEVLSTLAPLRQRQLPLPLGAYANTGRLLPNGSWEATEGLFPAVYAGFAKSWKEAGLAWIGGCCGTNPQHISAIREML